MAAVEESLRSTSMYPRTVKPVKMTAVTTVPRSLKPLRRWRRARTAKGTACQTAKPTVPSIEWSVIAEPPRCQRRHNNPGASTTSGSDRRAAFTVPWCPDFELFYPA